MSALVVVGLLIGAGIVGCIGDGYGWPVFELAAVSMFAAGLWVLLFELGALR